MLCPPCLLTTTRVARNPSFVLLCSVFMSASSAASGTPDSSLACSQSCSAAFEHMVALPRVLRLRWYRKIPPIETDLFLKSHCGRILRNVFPKSCSEKLRICPLTRTIYHHPLKDSKLCSRLSATPSAPWTTSPMHGWWRTRRRTPRMCLIRGTSLPSKETGVCTRIWSRCSRSTPGGVTKTPSATQPRFPV